MACHTSNLAFKSLELGLPTRVSAESSEVNAETYPAWSTITYEFPAHGDRPAVKLTWYEGAKGQERNLPNADLLQGEKIVDSGLLFVGEKGSIFTPSDYGGEQILLPRKEFADFKPPQPSIERLGNAEGSDTDQKREWIRAIQGGPAPMSNFDYASRMTESMLLGNLAVRMGKALEYDGNSGTITNDSKANELMRGTYRAGWEIA